MADVIKGSDPDDDGFKTTDLSAEVPTPRLGPPWRKEPAPEFILRGAPAEMVARMVCVTTTFVLLRVGVEMNAYVALVLAFLSPRLVGGGPLGVTFRIRWRDRSRGGQEEDQS